MGCGAASGGSHCRISRHSGSRAVSMVRASLEALKPVDDSASAQLEMKHQTSTRLSRCLAAHTLESDRGRVWSCFPIFSIAITRRSWQGPDPATQSIYSIIPPSTLKTRLSVVHVLQYSLMPPSARAGLPSHTSTPFLWWRSLVHCKGFQVAWGQALRECPLRLRLRQSAGHFGHLRPRMRSLTASR